MIWLIILLILFLASYGLTMWRLSDNKKKYGTFLRRDKCGRIDKDYIEKDKNVIVKKRIVKK